ncbi:type IV secretory system conjugative DNA transfer family protein [Streptomyces sp. HNM0663]|uniref:Type IV secretory system conjugative DNA transfer family protein n=1 Tax=Streptomyces chengmaiensis TaxID=3040919 RepID=A0ABT6HLD4_9ACTN|nr:type IV secretory system conjugative DNA transfer family protein [Streptomyces chengmaiensis]MDH2389073.1 type IV secretory system conjugative DNA transfer family protein [Streptomyces chengmaiensis]
MANPSNELLFSELHLPRPLSEASVLVLLGRLAAERTASRLVLEARAERGSVRYLLGCRSAEVSQLRRLFKDFLPGSQLVQSDNGRPPARLRVDVAGRLRLKPAGMPLRSDVAEATSRALLSALTAPLQADEALAVQIILGPRREPRTMAKDVPDPGASMVQKLVMGEVLASTDTRSRLRERQSQAGFAATIRLGVAGPDTRRRRNRILSLLSALTVAQGAGVKIDLVRESADRLNNVRLPWLWPLALGVSELVGLLGWPVGEGDLPGNPMHPRVLRAAAHVHCGPRVFARSAAPGDDRLLGISAADQTFHGIAYGPSGSGKTTALLHLVLADIEAGRPVVVLDPKQQLIDDVLARMPEHRVNDVVELNAANQSPVGFNPLDVTGRDLDVVVDGVLSVFESVFADGWGPRTADIFSASLRTLARGSSPKHPATLVDLPRLLTDAGFRRQYVGQTQNDVGLAQFWAWYDSQSPAAQANIIAAPMNKLRQFLLRPAMVRMLDQREGHFRLRNIFQDNKVLLVPLNEGIVGPGTASLLGSLVIAEIWQATQERANEPYASERPGTVYVDEAPRFLHLPMSLADALAVSRSLSVGWFLAAQFRDQFPPALRSAVDVNARSKIVFASEYEDARNMAKLAPGLEAEDFMALPRYHAYANLVADGAPSGWALVKTLPPPPATADVEAIRALARANYASPVEPKLARSETASSEESSAAVPPTPGGPSAIGRRRRRGTQ